MGKVPEQRGALPIIDCTPDALLAVDLQGTVVAFNRGAEKLFDLPASAVLGQGIAQSSLPESLRRCFAISLRGAFTGEPVPEESLEIEGQRAGRDAFVAKASFFTAGAGKEAVLAARLQDITERRQSEKKSQRRSRILKTMAGGNQAMVRATSEDELFQAMCRVIVETGGYRMAWIGQVERDEEKSIRPVAHAGHEEGYLALAKISWGDNPHGRGPTGMSIRTGTPQFNNDITSNPVMGPWRELALERGYLSSISLPLRDKAGVFGALTIYAGEPHAFGPDEVALLVELAEDVSYGVTALRTRRDHDEMARTLRLISERKQAEDALHESEERLAAALRAGKLGVYDYDPRTRRIKWDHTMYRLWGVPEGEPVTYETFEAGVHPEDVTAVRAAVEGCFDPGGTRRYECEYRVINRADGAVRWVAADGDVTFDGERPVRLVGIVQDITERKHADAVRREQETRDRYFLGLERRLREATSAREAVGAACEALGQELGATFSGVGELRPGSEHTIVESVWSTGDPSPFPGRQRTMGAKRIAELLAGGAITVEDVVTDPRLAGDEGVQAVYKEFGVRSSLNVPLMRDGRPRAFLFVAGASPRVWTDAEGALARETLDRAWQALERARAEAALRESEEKFRTLFETMSEGFSINEIILDEAGRPCDLRYLSVNPAFERQAGVGAADLVGRTTRELFPESEPMWFERYGKVALTGEPAHFEGEFGPLGRWFEVRVYRTQPGQFAVVFFDITERRRAEERLRESEERFRGIFEHAGTGIAIKDLEGRFQACNPAYAAMLGYSEDELRGLTCKHLMHPDDHALNMVQQERLIAGEIPSFESVTRYFSKQGKLLWAHRHISLLRDAGGQPTHLVALVTDITERKRHEEQVDLLMHEVNHRAKNMLTVVLAVARQTIATQPQDFIARFGERIGALAASQDLLVKNEWKGVDLEELVRSQLAHFKDLIGRRIELEGPSLFISASAAQTLGMALHELATNAGKYGALSTGEGRLQVEWGLDSAGGGDETFVMDWQERGGPPVTAPERRGFGSTVISRMATESLDAKVDLDFAPAGLSWRLQCPAKEVLDASRFASFSQNGFQA